MADQLAASHLPAYGNAVVHAPRSRGARARGRRLRERLLRVAALRAVALRAAGRPPAVGDRRLRQRGGAARRHADDRPRAARRRLRDGAGRQDALRRARISCTASRSASRRTCIRPGSTGRRTGASPPGERLEWYHNTASLRAAGVREAALQTDYDDEVCFRAVQKIRDLSLREDAEPFFLTVSFTNPHDPWEIRRRYWDLYDEGAIDPPAVGPIPREKADAHSLRLRAMIGLDQWPLSQGEVRRARHGYYSAVSYLDERIGEVLGALAATGLEQRHAGRLHGRPRRAAGRARPLVQDVVPRGLLARAADRARSGPDGAARTRSRSRSSTSPRPWPSSRRRPRRERSSRARASSEPCGESPEARPRPWASTSPRASRPRP